VELRSKTSQLWSAPGGESGSKGQVKRLCVKTGKKDEKTREMPDGAVEVWDVFYPRVNSMYENDKVNSAPCLIRDADTQPEARMLLERVPGKALDFRDPKRWHQALGAYCGSLLLRVVEGCPSESHIPTSAVENLKMRKRNLIDYVAALQDFKAEYRHVTLD
jgi:hypothetical protein